MYLEDRLLYQLCLVSSDRQVLELLGNHEGGLVPLKEPLLVQPEKDLVQLFVLMIQRIFQFILEQVIHGFRLLNFE